MVSDKKFNNNLIGYCLYERQISNVYINNVTSFSKCAT